MNGVSPGGEDRDDSRRRTFRHGRIDYYCRACGRWHSAYRFTLAGVCRIADEQGLRFLAKAGAPGRLHFKTKAAWLAWRVAQMRQEPTPEERIALAALRELGIPHEFQYPLGTDYILDFYLPENRLALEIDGGYHRAIEQEEADRLRDLEVLHRYGIKTHRLPARAVRKAKGWRLSALLEKLVGRVSDAQPGEPPHWRYVDLPQRDRDMARLEDIKMRSYKRAARHR